MHAYTARPPQAEAQRLLAAPPPDPDAATRRDFTGHCVITVDDASTTEIDDGLSLERLPDGSIKVRPGGSCCRLRTPAASGHGSV